MHIIINFTMLNDIFNLNYISSHINVYNMFIGILLSLLLNALYKKKLY